MPDKNTTHDEGIRTSVLSVFTLEFAVQIQITCSLAKDSPSASVPPASVQIEECGPMEDEGEGAEQEKTNKAF